MKRIFPLILFLTTAVELCMAQRNIIYKSTGVTIESNERIEFDEFTAWDIYTIYNYKVHPDTLLICKDITYLDDYSLKITENDLTAVDGKYLIRYQMNTHKIDTIYQVTDDWMVNSFAYNDSSTIIIASMNVVTQEIKISYVEINTAIEIWSKNVYEENLGLEYTRFKLECNKNQKQLVLTSVQKRYFLNLDDGNIIDAQVVIE